MSNEILVGRKAIADFLQISVSKLNYTLPELRKAGVCFDIVKGRPPHKNTCCVKATLVNWITIKAEKGESI